MEIVAETSRSWVIGKGYSECKVPKKGIHPGYAFSEEEVDDDCYLHDNRYKIAQLVERLIDVTSLRKIAEIVGYEKASA